MLGCRYPNWFSAIATLFVGLALLVPAQAFDTGWDLPELDDVRAVIADGSYDEAISLIDEILSAEPDNADALNLMGYAQRKAGRPEVAEIYYLQVMDLEPDHLGMLGYLGELYAETGRTTEAGANLSRLLELCGPDCEAYLSLEQAIADAR